MLNTSLLILTCEPSPQSKMNFSGSDDGLPNLGTVSQITPFSCKYNTITTHTEEMIGKSKCFFFVRLSLVGAAVTSAY